jgi:type II secretory pathway pseudopilin PulG
MKQENGINSRLFATSWRVRRPAVLSSCQTIVTAPPPRRIQFAAFTLVELLVVTLIVSILITLMLPTLMAAKERGKRVVSLNNTRQILLAVHLYASDFNDFLPYHGAGCPPFYKKSWCFAYDNSSATCDPKQGQVYPYLSSIAVFQCPSDRTNTTEFSQRVLKFTTYIWETSSSGGSGHLPWGGGAFNNGNGLKVSLFRADGILQFEPSESVPREWNDGADDYWEDETLHHDQGGVVGCYGGSAEFMKISTWKLEQNNFPSRINCNPKTPDGKGQ